MPVARTTHLDVLLLDSKLAMHFFQTFTSVFIRSGTQVAACAVAIPGLGPVGDILANIIALCESVPQNKYMPSL